MGTILTSRGVSYDRWCNSIRRFHFGRRNGCKALWLAGARFFILYDVSTRVTSVREGVQLWSPPL